jgi:hypothetical protein
MARRPLVAPCGLSAQTGYHESPTLPQCPG